MTLTVAQIERWNPEDLREVFRAANGRALAVFDAAEAMTRLPALRSWEGETADAAREAAGRLRQDLDDHGRQAVLVAEAAGRAADQIERIKADLGRVKADAHALGLRVDPDTSRIVPMEGNRYGRREIQTRIPALQARLNVVVAEATLVDMALAKAITMASTTAATWELPLSDGGPMPEQLSDVADISSGDITSIDRANRNLLQDLAEEYERLPEGQIKADRLADIAAIREALSVPDSYLLELHRPADPSQVIAAATSVGDPFWADHVSVTVPGVHGATRHSIGNMTREASELRLEAQDIARRIGASQNIATIAWAGYQPPPDIPSLETPSDDLAQAGAPKLTRFLQNLDDGSHNRGQTTALFGHSYGSLVSGIALRGGASSVVDNAVLYGSPGFQATSTAQLGMTDKNFFIMSTPDDMIRPIGAVAPMHGWGSDPNEVIPYDTTPGAPGRYRFPHLETDGGSTPIPGYEHKIGASGHSEYGKNASERMTGYNLATILLNRSDLAVHQISP